MVFELESELVWLVTGELLEKSLGDIDITSSDVDRKAVAEDMDNGVDIDKPSLLSVAIDGEFLDGDVFGELDSAKLEVGLVSIDTVEASKVAS
jgi:hypothetical protein